MEENFGSVLAKSLGQVLTTAAVEIPKQQEKDREAAITAFNTKLNFDAAMQQKQLMAGKIQEQNYNLTNLARLAVMTPEQRIEEMARQEGAKKQAELQATIDSALKNLGGLNQLKDQGIELPGYNFAKPEKDPAQMGLDDATRITSRNTALGRAGQPIPGDGASDKSLSAKDQMYWDELQAKYSEPVAQRKWGEYVANQDNAPELAADNYRALLNSYGGILGQVTKEGRAKAAAESGWSPKWKGTKQEILDGLDSKLKTKKISQEDYDRVAADVEKHFANLYDEIINTTYADENGK